jgi:hypothetical protein
MKVWQKRRKAAETTAVNSNNQEGGTQLKPGNYKMNGKEPAPTYR